MTDEEKQNTVITLCDDFLQLVRGELSSAEGGAGEWVEFYVPFFTKPNGDAFFVWIRTKDDGDFEFSDFGETMESLAIAGYNIKGRETTKWVEYALNGTGVIVSEVEPFGSHTPSITKTCAQEEFVSGLLVFTKAILDLYGLVTWKHITDEKLKET